MAQDRVVLKYDADGKPTGIDFAASARAFAEEQASTIKNGCHGAPQVEPKRFVVFVRPGLDDVKIELDAMREMSSAQIERFLARKRSATAR